MSNVNLKVVYLNKEPSYAGAVTLDRALLCRVTNYDPWAAEMRQKANVQAHFGAQSQNTLAAFMPLTLEIDLSGSGTAGTAPVYSDIFEICGRSVTEEETPDAVVVALDRTVQASAAVGIHVDNFLFKAVGVRGDLSFEYVAGQMPYLSAELVGIPVAITNTTLPVPDLSDFVEPVSINDANATISIWGYSGVLNRLSLKDGHEIVRRDKPNDKSVTLRSRQGSGNIEFELPGISTKDFMGLAKADGVGVISFELGTVAGNILAHALPNVQLINPKPTEVDGTLHISAGLVVMPSAGEVDDESTLTFT